jgi:hypothetical protein
MMRRFTCNFETKKQQIIEWMKVYYEHLLKLVNYLQVKIIDVFKVGLLHT